MESIKNIKSYMGNDHKINIKDDQKVLGYDEWNNKFRLVSYRRDSNCFFEYMGKSWVPYPLGRMHRFKHIELQGSIHCSEQIN